MPITQLQIEHFRNLINQSVDLSSNTNLITGSNGAGKTAFLEAVYFLGRLRSFRTLKTTNLVQKEKNYFRLIAKTDKPNHHIGIERRLQKQAISAKKVLDMTLRVDRQNEKPSVLIKLLPIIAITNKSFQLIDAGPHYRRQFLDYGVFHTAPAFFKAYQHYQSALKHRNAGLKRHMDKTLIDSYTPILLENGNIIEQCRERYLQPFVTALNQHLQALHFPYELHTRYKSGWNKAYTLAEILAKYWHHDLRLKQTNYGPHRADLEFFIDDEKAQNWLSRGQQKTLVLAMHLAQIELIQRLCQYEKMRCSPMLIFDDIAAEFDSYRRNHIVEYLQQFDCQLFVSSTEAELFDGKIVKDASLIHLNSGRIT